MMNDKIKQDKLAILMLHIPYLMASFDSIFEHTNAKSEAHTKFAIMSAVLLGLDDVGVITINKQ